VTPLRGKQSNTPSHVKGSSGQKTKNLTHDTQTHSQPNETLASTPLRKPELLFKNNTSSNISQHHATKHRKSEERE
jgi:hypothetical protein